MLKLGCADRSLQRAALKAARDGQKEKKSDEDDSSQDINVDNGQVAMDASVGRSEEDVSQRNDSSLTAKYVRSLLDDKPLHGRKKKQLHKAATEGDDDKTSREEKIVGNGDFDASCSEKKEKMPEFSYDKNAGNAKIPDLIVTAKPAIVLEDQLDSLSYIYDEVSPPPKKSGSSLGGDLYESIAGSLLNLALEKEGEADDPIYSTCLKKEDRLDSFGELDPHEVLTYTLTKLSEASNKNVKCSFLRATDRTSSSASSGSASILARRSVNSSVRSASAKSSDDWVDLEDTDTDYEETNLARAVVATLERNQSFAR